MVMECFISLRAGRTEQHCCPFDAVEVPIQQYVSCVQLRDQAGLGTCESCHLCVVAFGGECVVYLGNSGVSWQCLPPFSPFMLEACPEGLFCGSLSYIIAMVGECDKLLFI
jgi:hypothetical protein